MPSLYESTVNTGEVSSSNFTTLYNASGLQVPNAGAGSVTGNLNVGGNLTVQGSSLLIGDVTLQSTLSLPNYTFPLPDGTTDQVLVTDGNGNLYWTDVSAIPGADYSISATTVTGGANLTLANTAGFTDSVKFAAGTNMSIVRTDANTITISTVADNIPDGTAQGQVLYWDGSAWTANSEVTSIAAANRFTATYQNSTSSVVTAMRVNRDFDTYTYVDGDATGIQYQISSDTQPVTGIGVTAFSYSATDPSFLAVTTTDNFTTRTTVAAINKTDVRFDGNNLVLNYNLTGAPSENATITVNRGSSTDATITWDETDDRWELNYDLIAPGLQGGNIQVGINNDNNIYIGGNDLNLDTDGSHVVQSNSPIQTTAQSISINSDNTAADSQLNFKSTTQYLKWNNTTQQFELSNAALIGGNLTVNGIYSQTGESMTINSDSTAADSYLYMKGSSEYLKWDNTDTRFELSDQLFITQADFGAILERQTTTAQVSTESVPALQLIERVTDAGSNATDDAGPGIMFSRTSGAVGTGTVVNFAEIGANYFGTTNTAEYRFFWSDDNFTETSPGVYPGTYTLLRLGSDDANFQNNSIYIDYSTAGAAQVGINTGSPAYTLDVNGDARVTGNIITGGITAGNITVGVATDNTITTTTGDLDITALTGSTVNITSDVASTPVTLTRNTSSTNSLVRSARFAVNSTGTPAVGLSNALEFYTETAPTVFKTSGYIANRVTNVTTGSESFDFDFILTQNNVTATVATLSGAGDLQIDGDLTVSGNDIKSSTTATAITLDNTNIVVAGDVTINGQDIKSNGGTTAITLNGADVAVQGDLQVVGNDIRGSAGVDAITIAGANVTVAGDLAVNGGDITTTQTTFNLVDTTATTVNFAGAATAVNVGATTGTTTVNNDLTIHPSSTNATVQFGSQANINTVQTTTTSITATSIASTTRNAMNGTVNIKDNVTGAFHVVNFTALRNGATAMLTTYGELYTGSALANFTADISGGAVRLLATPASANSTTFNVVRTSIT